MKPYFVFNNGTISASGSQVFTGFESNEIVLVINILNAPTGTSPTLQFTIQEVDPVNQATSLGSSASSSIINAATATTIQISNSVSNTVQVSWTLGGSASPTFTGVNVTLVQKISGSTVTSNQGTANTLANAWTTEITDGTHGPVAVKAASTASIATDPSLVIAFSPNSPLPTGSNVVGAVTQSAGPWTENLTQIAGNAITTLAAGEQKVAVEGLAAAGAAVSGNPVQIGGKDPSGDAQPIALASEQSQYVTPSPNRRVVQSNATVTTNGSAIFSAYGNKEISLFINIKNAPTGTTPTITYTIQEVDPGDLVTVVGTSTTGSAITAIGTQILTLSVTKSGVIQVSWTVTGTTPSFTGVYATLVTKLPGVMIGVDSTGVQHPLLTDSSGNLKTNVAPVTGGAIAFGDVNLSAVTTAAVERTAYTEQSANFTGSVKSSSANDAAAGTGARTVTITYLDSTGAGPNTETVTLNGTTAVNLVNTNHCFIEKIVVTTVGSTGSNAGTISLFTGAAGAGTLVGTIGVNDNRTFWTHHYTPTGKTTYITGTLIGNSSTTVGAGATYAIKSLGYAIANAPETQVGDTLTLYGQSSMTPRLYTTAIPLAVGPARVRMYVTTLSATNQTYRASFDYYDQ